MGGSEKYYVVEDYLKTAHGRLGCITCHSGQNVLDKKKAHAGVVRDPSAAAGGICVQCHTAIGSTFATSIHYTIQGFRNALEDFAHPGVLEEEGGLKLAFDKNCYKCHATCGSCHVSRPAAYSGGLHRISSQRRRRA